tara:strand:- start:2900 stop:3073 length:174 start_codon:yes stop_codon:yes gene_type:complete
MKQNITENRKKYLKEYYLKNKEKQKKASYNQYRKNKGLNMDNSGLQVKKGIIIVDFN